MPQKGFEEPARMINAPVLDALAVVNRPEEDIRRFMTEAYRTSDIHALDLLAALLQERLDAFGFKHSIQYLQVEDLRKRAVAAYDFLKSELDELQALMPEQWADSVISSIIREMEEETTPNTGEQSPSRFETISVEHLSVLIQSATEKMMGTHHFEEQFPKLGIVLKDLQNEIDKRLKSPDLPDSEVGLLLEAKSKVDVAVEHFDATTQKYPESSAVDLEN